MFKRILPHICIDMAVIFLILWIMDRFCVLQLLTRETFKIPLVVFLVLVITESILLIIRQRSESSVSEEETDKKKDPET